MRYFNSNYLKRLRGKDRNRYMKLTRFISRTMPPDYDDYQRIGYEIIGPVLYGFAKWLESSRKKDGIEKLFFLAREGELLRKAYIIAAKGGGAETSYLRVSRMATSIPCLDRVNTPDELIKRVYLPRAGTMTDLLESCGLDEDTISEIARQAAVDTAAPAIGLPDGEKEKIYLAAKPYIDRQAKEQTELVNGYMKQQSFCGRCGIVDIGWKGTMQNNLEDLFPQVDMHGYYMGLRRDKAAVRNSAPNRHGFLFGDSEKVTETQRKMSSTLSVFENFFLSCDGSTLKYALENGVYVPVLNAPEHNERCAKIIRRVQRAALAFVKECADSPFGSSPLNADDCFAAYEKFAVTPSNKTVSLLRPFVVYNTETSYLVSEHSLLYYMVHPKAFYKDFLNNTCKVIFLKSVFLLPLPYYSLWKLLHSFDRTPINPIE